MSCLAVSTPRSCSYESPSPCLGLPRIFSYVAGLTSIQRIRTRGLVRGAPTAPTSRALVHCVIGSVNRAIFFISPLCGTAVKLKLGGISGRRRPPVHPALVSFGRFRARSGGLFESRTTTPPARAHTHVRGSSPRGAETKIRPVLPLQTRRDKAWARGWSLLSLENASPSQGKGAERVGSGSGVACATPRG